MEEEIEEQDVEDDPYLTDMDVHSAVFTGHLVYAFRNDNSLILRRELTPLIEKILEFITETNEKT